MSFLSPATNLVEGDYLCGIHSPGDPCTNLFLYDRTKERMELVSVGVDGRAGNGGSGGPTGLIHEQISPDGRFVVFTSIASNLVPNDPEPLQTNDVFVRDRKLKRTYMASVDSTGGHMQAATPSINATGRYIFFGGADIEGYAGVILRCPCRSGLWVHDLRTGESQVAGHIRDWRNKKA